MYVLISSLFFVLYNMVLGGVPPFQYTTKLFMWGLIYQPREGHANYHEQGKSVFLLGPLSKHL